jgi:chitodextrinase
LTNARFANNQYGSADFRLYVGSSQNVYIDKVTVSKTAFAVDSTPPSVPAGVGAAAQSETSIQVTWTASTDNVGVTGYKIFRNGGQVGASATTSFTDTGLSPSTTYSYTVSAYDAAGNNSAQSSPPATATTPDNTAPGVPTDVTATAQTPKSIQVTWTASTDNVGVTGYRIFRNSAQVGTSAATSFTDSGLTPNTTYSYTVSAYDAAGNNSAQSSPPATAATMQAMDIAAAKQLADSATVGFTGKTVIAVMADCLYIEETDRHSGIKVVPVQMPAGLAVGKTVDVGGTMLTGDNDERYIGDATVTVN